MPIFSTAFNLNYGNCERRRVERQGEHVLLATVGVLTHVAPESYNVWGPQQHGMMCRHFTRLSATGELFNCCGLI